MINPAMCRNISFRVESLQVKSGKGRIGTVRPNSQGVYCGLPMMILGERTQQNTFYDAQSVAEQFTNPESRINIMMRNGTAYGEWGHPDFTELKGDNQLTRLMKIDEKETSHLFTSIYTDKPSADGTVVVRGDVKPTGPYGAVFKESLDDPVINTAFSLRAYVDTKVQPDGLKYRTVRSLVTFDTVGSPGFRNTTKSNAIGLESFAGDQFHDYEIKVTEDGNLVIDQIALETFSNTDLNEIFGTSDISRLVQSRTFVETDKSMAEKFPNLYQRGIFHDYFKEV